jgi:DNA replication protein DnaC
MMDSSTVVRLHDLHLAEMAKEFQRQLSDPICGTMSFEERMALMVDLQWHNRKDARIERALKKAGLGVPGACIEDILYLPDRKMDKGMISSLASGNYIAEGRNIIIMGASGSGKSFIGCAFGNAACRNTLTTVYARLPDLLGELAVARAENTFRKTVKRYKNARLLILDEWLLYPLNPGEARDLLEIVEARAHGGSTIFCSQFAVEGWHEKIGEPTLADAVCDRIVHNSYKIILSGESMRKRMGIDGNIAEA